MIPVLSMGSPMQTDVSIYVFMQVSMHVYWFSPAAIIFLGRKKRIPC